MQIHYHFSQMVDYSRWDLLVFLQVVVVNVTLNQVWTALLIWLILTFPQKAFRFSPVLSAVAGFTSGFFIPINQIPWMYVSAIIQAQLKAKLYLSGQWSGCV